MTNKLGCLWCCIHFALEVICFQFYTAYFGNPEIALAATLIYDLIAFFPQFAIGAAVEKYRRLHIGKLGAALVLLGALSAFFPSLPVRIIGLILLSAGNACVHVGGAEATLFSCGDRIAPAAVFIAGGAFGVVTGRLLGSAQLSMWIGISVMLCAACLICISDSMRRNTDRIPSQLQLAHPKRHIIAVILLAFFTVTVRGLLAYGIPTGWNQSPLQTVALFSAMGLGKAAGGLLSDRFGAKKTALLSTGLCVPLLLLGNSRMIPSLLGIALFSMTTAATLGILVSAAPEHPLIAYGMTTVGLVAGSVPAMIPAVHTWISQAIVLTVLSALCFAALWYMMTPDAKKRR